MRLMRQRRAAVELVAEVFNGGVDDHGERRGPTALAGLRRRLDRQERRRLGELLVELDLAAQRDAGDLDREGEALRHLGEIFRGRVDFGNRRACRDATARGGRQPEFDLVLQQQLEAPVANSQEGRNDRAFLGVR